MRAHSSAVKAAISSSCGASCLQGCAPSLRVSTRERAAPNSRVEPCKGVEIGWTGECVAGVVWQGACCVETRRQRRKHRGSQLLVAPGGWQLLPAARPQACPCQSLAACGAPQMVAPRPAGAQRGSQGCRGGAGTLACRNSVTTGSTANVGSQGASKPKVAAATCGRRQASAAGGR